MVNPARAGMIPHDRSPPSTPARKPRASGDDPRGSMVRVISMM